MRQFLIVCAIFLCTISTVRAAVLINEISPSTNPEWVELYNDGGENIDLNGWLLEDGNSLHTDDVILTGTINSKSYIVFTHVDGWLNNGGDTLKLYNNASPSAIIDEYTYGSVSGDKTTARSPDGSEHWVSATPTQGTSNPTPTPSPSPSPIPSPTPSPTPSPSPPPSPTPTPKPSVRPSPNPDLSSPKTGTVAGEATVIDLSSFGVSPSPTLQLDGLDKLATKPVLNHDRAKTALLVGVGLVLVSVAGFFVYRRIMTK